ncbi:MAG: T9SS type A sorting domain-containing protein [Candidatus Kapaibacteriales bacterium]
MKHFTTAFLLSFAIVLISSLNSFSKEQLNNTIYCGKSFTPVQISMDNLPIGTLKQKGDQLLGVNFSVFDSLANAYSYFSESQQPFVYVPDIGQLITIKRGYWDIDKFPNYVGDNTKNNLFIRYSTDWGKSWSDPNLVYKVQFGQYSNWWARYPSVYAFEYDNDIAYVFTSPATNGSVWAGFINGLFYQGTFFLSYSKLFSWEDGFQYNWGGTDSRIVGGMEDEQPFALAVGSLMVAGGLPYEKTSNLGYRRTNDFDRWVETIPPQWQASVFKVPQSSTGDDSIRTSAMSGFAYGTDGNLYFAAYANFANSALNRFTFGVSKSTDNGKTWTDFDIMPENTFDSYLADYGLSLQQVFWSLPQFVPFDADNFSFIVNINEDTTQTGKPYQEALHQLVELYKENGIWGVRRVADLTGYVLAYVNSDGQSINNQLGEETQISRTVDGNYLVCKWVDFVDVKVGDTVYTRATNDIFVAVRKRYQSSWSNPINITESIDYDRITWIPNLVPNDLKDIPILKVMTIPIEGEDPNVARLRQRNPEGEPQYVMMGFFDVSTEPANVTFEHNGSISKLSVYPNPVSNVASINFYADGFVNLEVALFSSDGQWTKSFYNGPVSAGVKGLSFDLSEFANGLYFVVVNANGKRYSEPLLIVK